MEIMPNLRTKLIDEGAIVDNFLVNTPICCPSRTEFFTGRYFHNVGSPDIKGCMHADTTIAGSSKTGIFGVLKNHGYNVGIFGKATNDQSKILDQMSGEEKSVDYIDAPNGHSYHNYTTDEYFRYWSENDTTTVETIDPIDPVFGTIYQTAQLSNRTIRWLDTAIEDSLNQKNGKSRPFFAYIGPHAPHFPAQPAPWYEHAFDDVEAPITPNYNVSSPDKAQQIRQNPPLDDRVKCWENQHFRDRWASLLSVDDMIKEIYEFLEARLVLDNTYFIYSSDHGYKQGQWRIGIFPRVLSLLLPKYCNFLS
jgi:N-acetylglucosamine-6-sulfatase